MYKFSEYVLRRDEVNFNPNLGRVLPQSVRSNVNFSLPTAAMKTGAAALQGIGTLAGGMVAALSGVPVTIAAMQDAKTRFERAQAYILPYLVKDEGMRARVMQKVDSALAFLQSNKDTGVVGGSDELPAVQMGGVHSGVGSALWRGLTTSFKNLYDTLLNRSNKAGPFLKMLDQFKVMFESLGEMSKEVAYGKLRAFKQAAEVGSTYIDPDTMR